MKWALEFGNRGGAHTENQVMASGKVASKMAAALVATFENDTHASGAHVQSWATYKHVVRLTWQSETHFVAISRLDGVPRGPAAPGLWRKDGASTFMAGQVVTHGFGRGCN